jgi:methylenetetrahydrofolate--tRNA-(uracil-5-)-methyltransferase
VEGYTESAASGILAGVNLDRAIDGKEPALPPPTTMLGGLFRHLRECDPGRFQPMNSNWGLVDPLSERIREKRERRLRLAERATRDFLGWMGANGIGSANRAARSASEPIGIGVGSGASEGG